MGNENNNTNNLYKGDDDMVANVVKNESMFDEFLRINKEKINTLVPKNPTISQNDEWRKEHFWDDEDSNEENK